MITGPYYRTDQEDSSRFEESSSTFRSKVGLSQRRAMISVLYHETTSSTSLSNDGACSAGSLSVLVITADDRCAI